MPTKLDTKWDLFRFSHRPSYRTIGCFPGGTDSWLPVWSISGTLSPESRLAAGTIEVFGKRLA